MAAVGLAFLRGMTALNALHLGFCERITNLGFREHLQPLAAEHSLSLVSVWGMPNVDETVLGFLPGCLLKGTVAVS